MRIGSKSICAVIPTRGDVPMDAIVDHLKSYPEIAEVKVVVGTTTFNRYLVAATADENIIYTQDDDCITDIRLLIKNYEPGIIVNAMTKEHAKIYRKTQTLIGFGAIFNKSLVRSVMDPKWERDELFYSKVDRIFATVNEHNTVYPKIKILPCAMADNRLYRQADHTEKVHAMNLRIRAITGIRA
jgi:hypothetical protein